MDISHYGNATSTHPLHRYIYPPPLNKTEIHPQETLPSQQCS
jgi:hypothetical protein